MRCFVYTVTMPPSILGELMVLMQDAAAPSTDSTLVGASASPLIVSSCHSILLVDSGLTSAFMLGFENLF